MDSADQAFRDSISTVTKEGKRVWIYPKKPRGRYYNARIIVSIFLLLFLFIMPFVKVGGNQYFLLNIIERKFILFGMIFGPHDFFLMSIGMVAFIVFIFLFTSVFGRVFCGWICPQTVFMEMVFRKIEYMIEGNSLEQIRLDASKWTGSKILKKFTKWFIFYSISFLIANTFMAWIIGVDLTYNYILDGPREHFSSFIAVLAFSGLFYFVFSIFREQACTIVCPYGRLQGVLLDKSSLIIAYDYIRGEPRGKLKKGIQTNSGDCVDCSLCVDVCPTGIDIRNGTQLECVNCTACIDACDDVMIKINKPKGLIRFASLNSIEKGSTFKVTPRTIIYFAVFAILFTVMTVILVNRKDIDVTILRTPGMLYQEQPDNMISNLYSLNLVNKTFSNLPLNVKLNNIKGEIKVIGNELNIEPNGIIDAKILVILNKNDLNAMNTPLNIVLSSGDKIIDNINTSFLGPKINEK